MLDRECQYGITNFCLVTVEHATERNAHSGGLLIGKKHREGLSVFTEV